MLLFIEVSSTALILWLTLFAPLRNWLNSTKSSKRPQVFNLNLEYETFCERMWPKLFKNFPCIKQMPIVLWTDFLVFFLSLSPFIFKYSISDVLTTVKYMKARVLLSNYITSWLFDCDLRSTAFVISQYSCTIYLIVCLNNFIHLLWIIQHSVYSFDCFFLIFYDSWKKLFALTSHYIIFFPLLTLYSVGTM